MTRPLHTGHRRRGRGFTLIDMAVAMSILAILSAVLVPALSQKARNRQAEAAVEQVQLIVHAAKWYWHAEDAWPGQTSSSECGNINWWDTTAQNKINNASRADLHQPGYLPGFDFDNNPWGKPYHLDQVGTGDADPMGDIYNCWLRISLDLPTNQIAAVEPFYPNLQCRSQTGNGCWRNLTPATGFERCCIHIPRPGREPNLWYSIMDMDQIIPLLIPCSPWASNPGYRPDVPSEACPTTAVPP
ncbi:MAG: type II secretion system protein [Myxococcota bacterium]